MVIDLSIINSLLRDWGTDPLFWIFITGLPLVWFAVRKVTSSNRKRTAKRYSSRRKQRKFRKLPAFFALIWLSVVMVSSAPVVVNPWVDAWESKHALDESCAADTPIVVLGGGVNRLATSAEQTEYLKKPSYTRSAKAASLALTDLNAPIIVSGAGVNAAVTEADMMEAYMTQRGVTADQVYIDGQSQNTFENAVNVAALVKENEWGQNIRLVTSALHMPRAVAVFNANELQVCAIPVNYLAVKNVPWYALAPQTTALAKFRTYLHERIGVWVYQRKGLI